jgi:DNA-binding transcriptional LysR family regulator
MAGLNPPQGAALSLRQIEVFHAVMLTGSLSEAGRMLFVTQPAVSRILASAENRLRYPLFERVKGRLHPTPEARRLFAESERIFDHVNRFNTLSTGLAAGTAGTLSLVSSPSFSEWLIPRTIQRFREKHPGTAIRYRPLAFDMLLPHILLGHTDFGIASMSPPANANISAEEIGAGWLGCAIPRGHPLASRKRIRAEDLRGHLLIGYEAETPFGRLAARFLNSGDSPLVPDIEIRATPEALALVRQGVGVALIESFGYHPDFQRDFVLRPTAPTLPHKIQLLHAANSPLSTTARRFASALRQVLKEAPAAMA